MGKWGPVGACVRYASQLSQPMGDGAGVFIHHLPLVIVGGLLSVGAEQGINSLALLSRRSYEQKWIQKKERFKKEKAVQQRRAGAGSIGSWASMVEVRGLGREPVILLYTPSPLMLNAVGGQPGPARNGPCELL